MQPPRPCTRPRAALLAVATALVLVRCDCSAPCQVDGDCASNQICTRGICSVGNRLAVDAAVLDAGRTDAVPTDRAAADQGATDRAIEDRAASDGAASDRGHADAGAHDQATVADSARTDGGSTGLDHGTVVDGGAHDASQTDARLPDTRRSDAWQPDRQQPDAAHFDRAGPDASGPCQYNGQRCTVDAAFIVDELCLDGECAGYSDFATANCGASCTWPPSATCYFGRNVDTAVCGDHCRCGPTLLDPGPSVVRCENHSVCDYVAAADSLTMDCESQARCYLECGIESFCQLDCAASAMCRVSCTGSSTCTLGTCDGGWQDCGTNTSVCHRDCPF
jgi:hypothetical protein